MPESFKTPGPPPRWWGLPLLRQMRRDYLGFAEQQHRVHGDICCMRIGREAVYDVFTPELVRTALVEHADDLVPGAMRPCRGKRPLRTSTWTSSSRG